MRLLSYVVHLSQNFHLLRSRLWWLRSKVFEAILSLDRLSSPLWRFGSICCPKWPAPPMELLFQVMCRLSIYIFLLFDQETIYIFLLILFLRWSSLFCIFDQVLMIVDSLSAIFVGPGFVKWRIVIIGQLVEHGAILHIMVLCHQNSLLYLFEILLGSHPQLPFFHAHPVNFHTLFLFSHVALCSLLLGNFVCLSKFILVVFEEFLFSCPFFLHDFIIV